MSERTENLAAGLFVLVGLVLFIAILMRIYGVEVGGAETDRYYSLYSFSAGIKEGTTVRFGGLQRGKVTRVAIYEDDTSLVRIDFEVERGTPIKTDSEVRISALSMLGDYYIEITTGSTDAALAIAPDAPRPQPAVQLTGVEPANMNELFAKAGDLLDDIGTTLDIVNNGLLTDDRNALKERLRAVFDQIDTLLASANDLINDDNRANIAGAIATLRGMLDENRPDIRTTLTNVRDVSERLKGVMVDVEALIGDARPEVQEILTELNGTIDRADALLQNLDGMIAENRPTVNEMIYNLNATAANTRDLTETLSEEPWRLIWRSDEAPAPAVMGGT